MESANSSRLSLSAQRGREGPEQAVKILFRDSNTVAIDIMEEEKKEKVKKIEKERGFIVV